MLPRLFVGFAVTSGQRNKQKATTLRSYLPPIFNMDIWILRNFYLAGQDQTCQFRIEDTICLSGKLGKFFSPLIHITEKVEENKLGDNA